jgi:hypothetical protein
MKIFNVRINVQINQVAQIPDNPENTGPKPFNDDPVDKQSDMLDRYLGKVAHVFGPRSPMGASEGDRAEMTRSVNVAAETFEELQAILAKFNDTAKTLVAVPDSLLAAHDPSITPMR